MSQQMMLPLLMFIVPIILSRIFTPLIIKYGFRINLVGIDIHKPWKPQVPLTGGIALALSVFITLAVYFALTLSITVLAVLLALMIAFTLGIADDFYKLSPKLKVFLGLIAGIPVVLLSAYTPYPYVPIVGSLRITLLYPLLTLVAYAVLINAANMIDTHNGTLPSSVLIILTSSIPIQVYLLQRGVISYEALICSLIFLGSLIGYLPYNLFPARVLNGNSGSHLLGAILASVTIVSRLEIFMIISIMPIAVNGFNLLLSIGGLKSKEFIRRPVKVLDNGMIRALKDKNSPITLVQLLTLRHPLYEPEVVIGVLILMSIFCCIASLVSIVTYP